MPPPTHLVLAFRKANLDIINMTLKFLKSQSTRRLTIYSRYELTAITDPDIQVRNINKDSVEEELYQMYKQQLPIEECFKDAMPKHYSPQVIVFAKSLLGLPFYILKSGEIHLTEESTFNEVELQQTFEQYSRIEQREETFSTPAFIVKLYDILDVNVLIYLEQNNPQYSHIISWSEDGDYFRVTKPKLMEAHVLLHYFKHNHYTSFLRQLNMYEFLKARNSENHEVFSHPCFKRNNKSMLCRIKRNPIKSKKSKKSPYEVHLQPIKEKQALIDEQFTQILDQNSEILEQHKQIFSEMRQNRKLLDTKIERISYLLKYVLQDQIIKPMSPYRITVPSFLSFNFLDQSMLSPMLQLRNNSENNDSSYQLMSPPYEKN